MRSIIEYATPHLVSVAENAECTAPSIADTKAMERRTAELAGAPCRHVCPQHPVPTLDPAVWGRLPQELLELIFARLPLPGICRLRTLSQHWSRSLDARSHFSATCAKANNKMFALIEEDFDYYGKFWVKLYDVQTNNWHVYPLYVGEEIEEPYLTMSASDGGLVVFISAYKTTKKNPLQIVVVNLLTRSNRTFRLEGVRTHHVQMVQIITDCNTGHYKLIVVARIKKHGLVADTFFSERDEWESMNEDWWVYGPDRCFPEQFFGIKYSWDLERGRDPQFSDSYVPTQVPAGPCVYNYAEEKLVVLKDESYPEPLVGRVKSCALVKDRLFVLHEETVPFDDGFEEPLMWDRYCITEYQGQIPNPNWVRVRSISCHPTLANPSNVQYEMILHACRGFLLVKAYNNESDNPYHHEVGWIYDLSAGQWRELPQMREGHKLQYNKDILMVELRWDTDPNIEEDSYAPRIYPAAD